MNIPTGKFTTARRSLWQRTRLQLGVGLLLAVIIPFLVRYQLEYHAQDLDSLQNSLAATSFALIAGYYGFRRLTHYPGVRASYHILPSFAISYGLVLAVFFFARLDYSRVHFAASFSLGLLWYYIVYFKLQRQQRLRVGVIPFGAVDHLFEIPDVTWTRLTHPADRDIPVDAIVADLRADIPDEWERFLADSAIDGLLVMPPNGKTRNQIAPM